MNTADDALAVYTRGLGRSYGDVEAVAGLDLTVAAGETFGFLGPNGAGKSTTISMLCTLLRPTTGSAEVAGADVAHQPETVRRRIGAVFQESTSDRDLTGEQNLRFHAELYGMPRERGRAAARSVLDLMELTDRAKAPVATYSGGMRRRLEIARVLMHRPRVLFLDEPTTGLDPQSRARVWESLNDLRRRESICVFLTTHYLEEAEHCDRIAVVDHGRVVAEGTPGELKSAVGSDIVQLRTEDDEASAAAVRTRFALKATTGPDGVRVSAADGAAMVPVLCAGLPARIRSVSVTRPSLDDVFLHHTGRSIRDAAGAPVGEGPT
ncbi:MULTISPECIES: ATP-binding cassette domain-containing protein [Streptomyces]|jgi:ABC-2 type transport system ATP-binding protein|uniref:ATP-binding cassette domain-containing protein n=1 Tax=Streptomyces TaxID=1883 RepID=UPI001909021B|nr:MULTISPECIES: ATP-binding cassette domain-containing protein [unclassified Streptomyces]MCU4746095.1 ATP-binding cassette domain-containing protein [Streptomyces sp. G-5]QQN76424.1 ATP-binding cassette domain-containing protein [Streptomyces sp. XC 2026]